MCDKNVWDEGRWSDVKDVSIDFMTRYIFEKISARFCFKNKQILELGCGTGRLSYLALKAGAASVTLVDSSVKAVALATGLFGKESPDSCHVIQSDIFEFAPKQRFDLVFSSGLIEHFRGDDRSRILRHHVDLSGGDCIIIHPTDNLYSSIFNRLPQAIKLYGFQKSFSEEEIRTNLTGLDRVASFDSIRFHPFYTVPVLHNSETINRVLDRSGLGKVFGGLTLTCVQVAG